MSDEIPEVIYAYIDKSAIDKDFGGWVNYLCPHDPDKKYISQASSNQAVCDALDEALKSLIRSYLICRRDDAVEIFNNLKSKYEGE